MTWTHLPRAIWRKSSHSGAGGGTDDCVELAAFQDGRVAVRDSKCLDGAVLVFSGTEMAAWIRSVKKNDNAGLA